MDIALAAFLGALAAFACVLVLALALRARIGLVLLRAFSGRLVQFLSQRFYPNNLFGALNLVRHVGLQNLVETMLRANQGTNFQRPWGSPLALSPWEQLLFQPVYLSPRLPTPKDAEIATDVVIGPRAGRPLALKIPILVSGMAFGGAITEEVKLAWAKGANLAGTATNTGESYLPSERRAAEHLIVQLTRGLWAHSTMNQRELLESADAIEVNLGEGAQSSAPVRTPPDHVGPRMREVFGLAQGEALQVSTRLRGVDAPADFVRLVFDLKSRHEVPVGVKVGAGDYLEQDLDLFVEAGVDFVVLDGAEGGTHGSPTALSDDVGIPTMHAIARADRHLRRRGARAGLSLIATGQLTTPGRLLKALALGADAVYIGTTASLAILTDQVERIPILHPGRRAWTWQLDVDAAAGHLATYLESCMGEIRDVVRTLGKTSVAEVGREDLVALTRDAAEIAGVRLAWSRPVADILKDIVHSVDEALPEREELLPR